jgi:methionyl-tRNA formyltransferase
MTRAAHRAVVFAYHNVGVRCLSVLLAHGIEVPLLLTHRDDPRETIWFDSVADLAALHGIPAIMPEDANAHEVVARIAALEPDFLFSFYYRQMLGPELLACARRGAWNLHGSLLPRYRGRVPVNWAVIRGERETGATLHEMVAKPDAGRIVDQMAVPILPDDTAVQVFHKVTVAAEIVLDRALPGLIAGTAQLRDQDLAQGSYFGGRKPEDGRIDWTKPASEIHNLIRGVAPPYPGAFSDHPWGHLRVLRSLSPRGETGPHAAPTLFASEGRILAQCGDGRLLPILQAELDGRPLSPDHPELSAGFPLDPESSIL